MKLIVVNIEALATDIKQLIIQQKVMQRAIETGDLADKNILHPKDRIRHVVEAYLPTAIKKTNFLLTLLEDMETSFDNCMVYYCEEPRDLTARSQFFSKFDSFIKDYKRVKKENFDMEEEEHRAVMRKKALLKAGQKNILEQAMAQSPNHAVMDNLLDKLRVGPDSETRRIRKKNLPAHRGPALNRALRQVSDEQSSLRIPSGSASESEGPLDSKQDNEEAAATGTSTPSGNTAVLAARAQSMLAGLRNGKIIRPASESTSAETSPSKSAFSMQRTASLGSVVEEQATTDEPLGPEDVREHMNIGD